MNALSERYAIERELGAGGMATVYLARDLKHSRDVAIKILKPDLAASLGRERFLREIQLAAKLSHPHILPLHDSGESEGSLFYVMPSVEGQSLRDRLDSGPLPVDEAVRIAQDVASALEYAHRHDVVHRDIKPENILLQDGQALLADFGIGKLISDMADDTLTQVGTSLGTPAYMSPEQAVGESVDGRTDIYALGCVLYEMLVGEPPFTGPNAQSVIAKRFVQTPADVMGLREGVTRPVARAVQKALARIPIDRYHTASELLVALREVEIATPGSTKGAAPAKSIAVLPFENLSSDRENEYFGDGIAEEIINVLAQVKGLQVAARTSAFSFKGKPEDLRSIGEKLNVATVLEGSVRRAGNRLRITAQLIAVADGYHLWSERYDRELVDVFAVQDEIAASIAVKLQVTMDRPAAATDPATPEQVEAYELYHRARALMVRRVTLDQAIVLFERAIALEPDYARAHADLAEALRLQGQLGAMPASEAVPRAKQSIARALSLDPGMAEALGTAAVIAMGFDHDAGAALNLWEQALAINPQLSEVRVMYALYGLQLARDDDDRAVAEARRALREDPRSGIVAALAAQTFAHAGLLADAKAAAERALEIENSSMLALSTGSMVLCALGDGDAALALARLAMRLSGREPLCVANCAVAEGVCGRPERAASYYKELRARAEQEPVLKMALAMTAHAAGNIEDAMMFAIQSAEEGELLSASLARWGFLASLRKHPRFAEFQARQRAH